MRGMLMSTTYEVERLSAAGLARAQRLDTVDRLVVCQPASPGSRWYMRTVDDIVDDEDAGLA